MEEETDLFEDAVSVNSVDSGSVLKKGSEYIGLSRCTVYHSLQDLHTKESDDEGNPMMAARHDTVESCSGNHETQVRAGGFWNCAPLIGITPQLCEIHCDLQKLK
jgi:hypothetical protein